VRKGDTILSIARRFKVHTGEIRRLNGLSATYEVKPGDVLKIP
jgi:LysM repeat protein